MYPDSDLRLPAYRVSHVLRYHPYPRSHLPYHEAIQRMPLQLDEDDDTFYRRGFTGAADTSVPTNDDETYIPDEICIALQEALAHRVPQTNKVEPVQSLKHASCLNPYTKSKAGVSEDFELKAQALKTSFKKVQTFSITVIDLALLVIKAIRLHRSAGNQEKK